MGILEAGSILEWENNEYSREFVKNKGIEQFISLYNLHKDRSDSLESLKWGEEIEFNMVEFNHTDQSIIPYYNCEEVQKQLQKLESTVSNHNNNIRQSEWLYEYGSYMIESVPSFPYDLNLNSIPLLQKSLSYRRWKLETVLPPNVSGMTLTGIPNLGSKHFSQKDKFQPISERITNSVFLENNVITNHSRFKYLSLNIYKRRKAKVLILIPLKIDSLTYSNDQWDDSVEINTINRFQVDALSKKTSNPIRDYIYMDSMGFGMGLSCAQCTYMLPDINTARYIYDQYTVLAPLLLAMTASTPFHRGMIASTDVRWDTISQSVDCRTEEEMEYIGKSRYASVSQFISNNPTLVDNEKELNDLNITINEDAYDKLTQAGIDSLLAKHIAHLFIRDPLVIFKESLIEDNPFYLSHFDNIQSTNWNSVRFKPPTSFTNSNSEIGWRVEFRTLELQMTDFENAAFISLITILTQIILKENIELYIPISKCDDNFKASHKENSIINEKFWFRNDITSSNNDLSYRQMSLEEIMLSRDSENNSTGLITRSIDFVNNEYNNGNCSREAHDTLLKYFEFISMRVRGNIETNATFLRRLINTHPDYKNDSIIPETAAYDICQIANRVGSLNMQIPEMFGPFINNFNAGFENSTSPKLQLNSFPTSSLDTESSFEYKKFFTSNLQRYLFSIFQNSGSINEEFSQEIIKDSIESDLARITTFVTSKSINKSFLNDSENNDKRHIVNLTGNDNTLKLEKFSSKIQDFVINEDFTKSWMMKKWLTDSDISTSYTNDLKDFNDREKVKNYLLISDLPSDLEYICTVNELSA